MRTLGWTRDSKVDNGDSGLDISDTGEFCGHCDGHWVELGGHRVQWAGH